MSVWILQVSNESSFATNSRGSNYPSGENTHLLPERNCNQMPKTLAQRFFWMWITLSGEVKVSLSNLPPCYKKPWKLQHSIILQGKKADLKRLICTLQMVHTKKNSRRQKAEDKEMLMSMWLRHAKGSHQCSQILNWESCQQIWSACLVAIISQGCALPAPYSQQWNRAHLPAQRYKDHSTGPKLSITHQCIMKDGW
jgi:hypothetical protein